MRFRRWIALLLVGLLLAGLLPGVMAAAPEEADLWEQICAVEEAELAQAGYGETRTAQRPTAADFAAISPKVESLVRASADCRPGSIERHGDFFFWESADGTPNGYSPRLRALTYQQAAEGEPAEEDPGDTSLRGGTNRSIHAAVLQPYYGMDASFKETYVNEAKRIADAMGGNCVAYRGTQATVDRLAWAMSNCGVVIVDSHGDTDYASGEDHSSRANTSYILLHSGAGLTSADMKRVKGSYGNYYHAYYAGKSGSMQLYCVDGTVIANHMKERGKNSFVWLATCFGMATAGIAQPLRAKGVEAVYGYSQSVTFKGDYLYEDPFWDHMIAGYTAGQSVAYMKQVTGKKWDPGMPNCTTTAEALRAYAAFPILVSSEDAYPGQGRVDAIQTPSSAWRLKYDGCTGCPGAIFNDMPPKSHWAHEAIDWAIEHNITSGTSETAFSPGTGCTRAQAVTFLWRAAGFPSAGGARNPFTDVSPTSYYYAAVLWAVSQGITSGTSQTQFSPDKACTRGQIVTFLWRTAGCPERGGTNPFADVAEDAYYNSAVRWAVDCGITSGVSATKFSPQGTCTREQIVTFLYRSIRQH